MAKKRRQPKNQTLDLVEAYATIRTPGPDDLNADSDRFVLSFNGQKDNRQRGWVHGDLSLDRALIVPFALALHRLVTLEERKAAKKRAALENGA